MNVDAWRAWGIAASGAFMAGALAVSFSTPPLASAKQEEAAPLAFNVRFRGGGPIARAQDLAARDQALATRVVEQQLARQEAFAGLCLDRFTPGGGELVLRSCAPVAAELRDGVAARWLAQLRAMRAIEYANETGAAPLERASLQGEP